MNSTGPSERLLRADEHLSRLDWPCATPIDGLFLSPRDCLIVAAGFEKRAIAALASARKMSENFHVCLVHYEPLIAENREDRLVELCQEMQASVEMIVYDREEPSGIGSSVVNCIRSIEEVFIDVSGMSRLLIVQLIVAITETRRRFNILYTKALTYPPVEHEFLERLSSSEFKPAFISSGIFEVVSAPELSSVSMMGGPIRLVSFPSFDSSQLSNLVQEIQPTHNNVIHGVPPSPLLAWRRVAIERLNASTIDSLQRVEEHCVSTFDYRETIELILALYDKYSVFDRFVIAPTGSKMQAVAVGILRGALKDLQIVYPTLLKFIEPARYTEGVEQTFRLTVEFPSSLNQVDLGHTD